MSISGLQFLIALLFLSTIFVYLRGRHSRQIVLAGCNAGFLWLLIPNAESWVTLGVWLFSGYIVGRLLERRPNQAVRVAYIVVLVAAFLVIKKYDLVTLYLPKSIAANTVYIVGVSYMLFRQVHFLVDASQGQVGQVSLWSYANYQLNFFTLLSGPIQRFQEFQPQWEELSPALANRGEVQSAHFRILFGVVKMAVIAPFFLNFISDHY